MESAFQYGKERIIMKMPRWILEAETRVIDQDRELENLPFKEGDVELGEVPLELRELYFVRNVLLREAGTIHKAHRKVCYDLECSCEEIVDAIENLQAQFDCIDDLFWVSLDIIFCPNEYAIIDIRDGWKVVRCLEEDTEDADELDVALTDAISRGRVVANLANLDMDQSRAN